MKKLFFQTIKAVLVLGMVGGLMYLSSSRDYLHASSHREAPLIANDPLADNTDVYAFRSPDDTNSITILANYIPGELPQGGPNYYTFGENINYEIHIKNDPTTVGDDITYRFVFTHVNEDSTTFFNIRLGKQNLKTTYDCFRKTNTTDWKKIISGGIVPPPNIGPRSIEDPVLGLGETYEQLFESAVTSANGAGHETVYCGPADDPFFVDLGGIFDLGQTRAGGTGENAPLDALACHNVHVIALKVPISTLGKTHNTVKKAKNILDPDYVIGVWASASRPRITKAYTTGQPGYTYSSDYVQVSRLGMPLTNEAIVPIGDKDEWNVKTPYNEDPDFQNYFVNPELALYMDDAQFGSAIPALSQLRIQTASQTVLGSINFTNYHDGLYAIYGNPATFGTALDPTLYGNFLLQKGNPRSVDLLPIFYTGVPNLSPYQLATGKPDGNPLAPGKPFINNFLPTFGDMLRLNMAVPVTPRTSSDFSSEGIIQACVLGLTDPRYNTTTDLQFIPNMDGFPNGRRLEDDVTRIELQAVSGVALAAIGLFYDDHTIGIGQSPVTQDLINVLSYTTGIEHNDTTYRTSFPYVQVPWSGYGKCGGPIVNAGGLKEGGLQIHSPEIVAVENYPNPFNQSTTIKYHLAGDGRVTIQVVDLSGRLIAVVEDGQKKAGDYLVTWNPDKRLTSGEYIGTIAYNGIVYGTMKMNLVR